MGRTRIIAGRAALLLLLASFAAFAGQKTWQLPSDSAAWSLTDLDGDRVADLANAGPGLRDGSRYLHKVVIGLSHFQPTSLLVRGASESISLSFRDIDGDHDRDLIVFEPESPQPLGVWLNDGAGHFIEGDLAHYAAVIGHPGPESFAAPVPVTDKLAGLSGGDNSFHVSPSSPLPAASSSREPVLFSVTIPRNTGHDAFAPRGPPSRS